MAFTPDWSEDHWPRCPRCGYSIAPRTRATVDVTADSWPPLRAGRWHGTCHEREVGEYRARYTGKGGRYDVAGEAA